MTRFERSDVTKYQIDLLCLITYAAAVVGRHIV